VSIIIYIYAVIIYRIRSKVYMQRLCQLYNIVGGVVGDCGCACVCCAVRVKAGSAKALLWEYNDVSCMTRVYIILLYSCPRRWSTKPPRIGFSRHRGAKSAAVTMTTPLDHLLQTFTLRLR